MIRGIDVSSLQGTIDWATERERFEFAIIRNGMGNEAPDGKVAINLERARAAGFVVGVYNVSYPLRTDGKHLNRAPVDQARWHALEWRKGDLPPAVDLEWPAPEDWTKWGVTAKSIVDWHLAYLEEMTRLVGIRPTVYTYPYYAAKLLEGSSSATMQSLGAYPLWLAKYHDSDIGSPDAPFPWTTVEIQQTEGGDTTHLTNGCPVDVDVYLGSETAWKRLRGL